MDRGPRQLKNSTSRLIALAVQLAGNADAVRSAMHATDEDFADYRGGRKEPAWVQYERLISFIIEEQSKIIEVRRAHVARIRAQVKKPK